MLCRGRRCGACGACVCVRGGGSAAANGTRRPAPPRRGGSSVFGELNLRFILVTALGGRGGAGGTACGGGARIGAFPRLRRCPAQGEGPQRILSRS